MNRKESSEDALNTFTSETISGWDAIKARIEEHTGWWPEPAEFFLNSKAGAARYLMKKGFPDPALRMVHQVGRFWCVELSDELPDQFMNCSALTYIMNQAKPPSAEWYAAKIYFAAEEAERGLQNGDTRTLVNRTRELADLLYERKVRANGIVDEAETARAQKQQRRENGKLGGQAKTKLERYQVLDRLANKNLERFAFVSDKQALRTARELAGNYDKGADPSSRLFWYNSHLLSISWFSEWLIHFREICKNTN